MRGLTLADAALTARSASPTGLNLITWKHAAWAGDPAWTNPGDGNPVDSMRNPASGFNPASTGSNRPTYRASVAAYNNKPAVEFVGASSQYLDVNIADMGQPYSLVVVGNTSGADGVAERLIATGVQANAGIGDVAGNTFFANEGATLTGPACNANPHLHRLYANGASSVYAIDGTTVASGNASTNAAARLTIGASSTSTPAFASYLTGNIVFIGIASGDVSARDGWAAFKAWVASEYGLTIA